MTDFLRSVNTFANVINAVTILVLLAMLLRSKQQMAKALDKLSDALATQVRRDSPRSLNEDLRKRPEDR